MNSTCGSSSIRRSDRRITSKYSHDINETYVTQYIRGTVEILDSLWCIRTRRTFPNVSNLCTIPNTTLSMDVRPTEILRFVLQYLGVIVVY